MSIRFWACILLLAVTGRVSYPAAAGNETEAYIQDALAHGQVADLRAHFPDPQRRVITAGFLEALLNANADTTIHRQGVRITGAIVREPIDLVNATVTADTKLEDCAFEAPVNLSHSEWKQDLTLNGSSFQSFDLSRSAIAGSLRIERAAFRGHAAFAFLYAGRTIDADGVSFSDVASPVSFNSIVTGSDARFTHAVFAGGSDFVQAHIGASLLLGNASFSHSDSAARFSQIHVGESVYADGPIDFAGPVSFEGANVGRDVDLTGSHFRSTRHAADFTNITVGNDFDLDEGKFSGPFLLTRALIQGLLRLDDAVFSGSAPQLNLVRIGSILRMVGASFSGGLNLTGAELKDDLNATRAHFSSANAKLTLYRANLTQGLYLNEAILEGPVDCKQMRVGMDANFENSKFLSPAGVTFSGSDVGSDLTLTAAEFSGPVDLTQVKVGSDLSIDTAIASQGAGFDLTDARIGRDLDLTGAIFRDSFETADADAKGSLLAKGVRFLNARAPVSFNSLHVHVNSDFTGALFTGKVDMVSFEDDEDLYLDSVHAYGEIDAERLKLGQDFRMTGASFDGSADFDGTTVGGDWIASDTHFTAAKELSVEGVHIGGDFDFSQAELKGGMSGIRAVVTGYASFEGSRVGGRSFSLNAARVGRFLNLDDADMDASMNLVKIELGTDLRLNRARLHDHPAELSRMTVVGDGFFDHLQTVSLNLTDSAFYNAQLQNLQLRGAPGELRLSRVSIQRDLNLADLNANRVLGDGLKVGGTARFGALEVSREFSLEDSSFETLQFKDVKLVKFPENALRLDAMTFHETSVSNGTQGVEALLPLLERAAFSPSMYSNLEQYCARNGLDETGRKVFVNYQRRLAREGSWIRRPWTFLLDGFVRFGKSPERAFLYAIVFIFVGRIVFARRRMTPLKPEFASYHYNAWWYSVDRLIPVADLGMKNSFGPSQKSRIARNYMRLHIIFGYLLITVGLAAVTGLVK